MMVYDEDYESNGFVFKAGLMTSRSVLGICINLDDEKILQLVNNPELLAECLQEIIPNIIFNEAHRELYHIADQNGYRGQYYHQWEEYFSELGYQSLTKLKNQAELVLNHCDECDPRAVNNAKIVIECLNGNFPPRYVKEKSATEIAKASFEKKKPKLRLKLVIRDGYKCAFCAKDTEDSLCIVKRDYGNESLELENLILSCRRCINLNRKKK